MRLSLFLALLFSTGVVVLAPPVHASSREEREKKKRHKEAQALLQKGLDAMGEGNFDQALEQFKAAEAVEPSAAITQNIGATYEALGNIPEALAAYRKYIEQSPDAPDLDATRKHVEELEAGVHVDAAKKLVEQKQLPEAIREYEAAQAIKADPKVWYDIGNTAEEMGDDKKAVASYKKYLAAAPDAPDRGEVEGRINVLEGKHLVAPAPPPPPPPPVRKPFYSSKPGLIAAGGGVVLLGVGLGLVGASSAASSDADSARTEADFQSAVDRGQVTSGLGVTFSILGAVALVAGGVLMYLQQLPEKAPPPTETPAQASGSPAWLPSASATVGGY